MDWKNHLEKNPIQKIEKNSKNQSEIAACEQTYPADCRKIAAVDSNKHDWD